MCGISGAIGYVDDAVLAAVRRMSDRQTSRGPDSSGEWRKGQSGDPHGGAVLAFRRLKIIDLSDDANQPMVDKETGNAIVFNGEIYNFMELRSALHAEGFSFKTKSDTEVILKAYAKWGRGSVSRLRGMFAFLIWDSKRNCAFAARDRLGIKPLYFSIVSTHDSSKTVLVASQVRAILA